MKWFREASFGMFIHWGLYAIPAGVWEGRETPVEGEWIMRHMKIPLKDYEQLATQFNPVDFDAEKWVRVAKDAGMKYLVITAKHHDGFALYHSQCDKYNIYDATPFKRDPMAELAKACAKAGLKFGFYYSQDQDWHEPGGSGNDWSFQRGVLVEKLEGDLPRPTKWRIFGGLTRKDGYPTDAELKAIPSNLTINGKVSIPKDIEMKDTRFNFEPFLPPHGSEGGDGRVAYAYTKLSVEKATTVSFGAGADWYMEWWLDGVQVMNTASGNSRRPIDITNQVFNVKLTPGEHVLTLRFISGMDGADFAFGGPNDLRAAGWKPNLKRYKEMIPVGLDPRTAFQRYLDNKVKPQLRELLTNYGPVAVIWFDTPCLISLEQSKDLKDFVHSLQPDCLVSGRVGNGMGDYQSLGDNEMPNKPLVGEWEGLGTTNHSWGYKISDNEWKTPKHLLKFLIELTAKNANYILNVGPTAQGVIPEPAVKSLKAIGKWLKANGEAIYGAKPLPFTPRAPWGFVTRKGNTLYLLVTEELLDSSLSFFGLRNKAKAVRLLGFGPAKFEETHKPDFDYHKLAIEIPKKVKSSKLPFVVAIETESEIDVNEKAYSCSGTC